MAAKKTSTKKTTVDTSARKTVSSKTQKTGSVISLDNYLDLVKAKAYEIYQKRGGVHGSDLDDWLRAEKEIRQQYGLK